jgi:hypothetical protein
MIRMMLLKQWRLLMVRKLKANQFGFKLQGELIQEKLLLEGMQVRGDQ